MIFIINGGAHLLGVEELRLLVAELDQLLTNGAKVGEHLTRPKM